MLGMRFTHSADVASTLVSVRGAETSFEECAFYLSRGDDRVGIDVSEGKVSIAASEFDAEDVAAGTFLRGRGATLSVTSTRFRGPRSAGSFSALMVQQGSTATLSDVGIEPGGARRSDGIAVNGSELRLVRSTVASGALPCRAPRYGPSARVST